MGAREVLLTALPQSERQPHMRAYLILGNQLHRDHPALAVDNTDPIIMVESAAACSRLPYHQQKLTFILSAMRHFRDYARSHDKTVHYNELQPKSLVKILPEIVAAHQITHLLYQRPADKGMRQALETWAKSNNIKTEILPSQLFMTSPGQFSEWYTSQKLPKMESFYRQQRIRTGYLMEGGKPQGDTWNYDQENRKPLPKNFASTPNIYIPNPDKTTTEVHALVKQSFATHPGSTSEPWLPVTFVEADKALHRFITERLPQFGMYEDAMRDGDAFLFHSVLSPLINVGLLSPKTVVEAAIASDAPLAAKEGFVRQIIGWREYMYGLYNHMPELATANYFGFTKELEPWWYTTDFASQPIPKAVKHALRTVHQYGYNHHIERLMILGNWFLLNEYNPHSVNRWFMSMYVDAAEWVMLPNVIGMSQYADGGRVATKPYISGDSYLKKMGRFEPSTTGANYTDLFWKFLYKHHTQLVSNHRMSMMLRQAQKRHTDNQHTMR